MPTYTYRTKGGKIRELFFHAGEAPGHVTIDGEQAVHAFWIERQSVPPSAGWPMTCFASGVHPDQAGQLRAHFDKAGVSTDVNLNGDPIYKSAAHRKKALACRGMNDRSSFS